ncbi:MAG: hypothetical protein JWQ35_461 [Bacteriovoracaceae bacterium]|nr:hypothetical protein [Bacteriovoracaceae bacterium]
MSGIRIKIKKERIPRHRHPGFLANEDLTQRDEGNSKFGGSVGMTENVLASSEEASSSPDSSSTGEDTDPLEVLIIFEEQMKKQSPEEFRETNSDEDEEERETYATGSDELEMGTAYLEEATGGSTGHHDPASADAEVEEVDDEDRL